MFTEQQAVKFKDLRQGQGQVPLAVSRRDVGREGLGEKERRGAGTGSPTQSRVAWRAPVLTGISKVKCVRPARVDVLSKKQAWKAGVPWCLGGREAVRHCLVAIETSRRRWVAGEGGGSGGGRGGGSDGGRGAGFCSSGSAAFLSQRWREPERTEPPARAPGPLPARHHGEGGGQPAPPALAWPSGGSELLPAPGLVPRQAQVGIPDGDSWKRLHGECPPTPTPSCPCLPTSRTWQEAYRQSQWTWVGAAWILGGPLQNQDPPQQEDRPHCRFPPLPLCPSLHHRHRSRL